MIKNIIFSLLFACLLLSLSLALMGVREVSLGAPTIALINRTSVELDSFRIAIPSIPSIPSISYQASGQWYSFLIDGVNAIIIFLNGLVNVINFVITGVNVIIQIIQFIIILIKNVIVYRDSLISQIS